MLVSVAIVRVVDVMVVGIVMRVVVVMVMVVIVIVGVDVGVDVVMRITVVMGMDVGMDAMVMVIIVGMSVFVSVRCQDFRSSMCWTFKVWNLTDWFQTDSKCPGR